MTTPIPKLHAAHNHFSTPSGPVAIPLRRESEATFAFLGFNPAEAKRRWRLEKQMMNHVLPEQTLLETVLDNLPERIGLDFQQYFDHYNISKDLQEAIMDPEFADIRGTASPGYWVRDTICGRVTVLEDYFTCRGYTRLYEPLAPITPVEDHQELQQDCVTLYKGVGSWRTAKLFEGNKASRVTLHHLTIQELDCGDFSSAKDGLYFTPHKDLAMKFARYATRRTYGIGSSRIIRICIPKDFLDLFQHRRLLWDDERDAWRKVVKMCRFGRLFPGAPSGLSKLLSENEYLIGHVSTGHEDAPIRASRGFDSYKDLDKEKNLLYLRDKDGKRELAEQWMFKKNILDSLEEALGPDGKGHIAVEMPVATMEETTAHDNRNDSWVSVADEPSSRKVFRDSVFATEKRCLI